MDRYRQLTQAVERLRNQNKARSAQRFFKTGPGQYGEGDIFYGLTVPESREVAKKFPDLSLRDLDRLLASPIHENRLIGLLIAVGLYDKMPKKRTAIFSWYIKNLKRADNWDLVDSSADKIAGRHLRGKDAAILRRLARSDNLWERRVAIVATFAFIKEGRYEDTLAISTMLLSDPHDLIHKATGWMLREVGKRDIKTLERFLERYASRMPRTALRYSIERFPEKKRKYYLSMKKV
jgi:3-methyladenine DNA glycosylase AlkD